MKMYIEAKAMSVRLGNDVVLQDMTFNIRQGEAWAIVGPSGSGKSVLLDTLLHRRMPDQGVLNSHYPRNTRVQYVSQQHFFKHYDRLFYQARFNSSDSENSPLVQEVLVQGLTEDQQHQKQVMAVLKLLKIEHLYLSRVGKLSNGEHKRLQLAQALLHQPEILMLDNPFTGLDTASRTTLHEVLNHLIAEGTLVLLITSATEIPTSITHVMSLEAGSVRKIVRRQDFVQLAATKSFKSAAKLPERHMPATELPFTTAIKMQQVSVRYGDRKVLDNINWEVKKGEKWALLGHNGAGKSTLLSLVTGDNPQAYANNLWLFDRKRGSGESIWDIKRQIGYVSPELHVYFQRTMRCEDAISSGFADRMIPGRHLTDDQHEQIKDWMRYLNIEHLQGKMMGSLATGEQRLVLLSRALVKNPAMLILDEPCQGLDDDQKANYLALLENICQHGEKTLIYVSHYATDIPACVNQLLRLENGHVV